MDASNTVVEHENAVSPKPMPLVLGVLLIAFCTSFVVTSLRNYGGFNYGGHTTSLSNAIFESVGAVFIFPLLHLAIASFWNVKRTSRTRRNIFFGWGLAVVGIQLFGIAQVFAPMTNQRETASRELAAPSTQLEARSMSPAVSVREKVTVGSWNRDISHFLGVQSTNTLASGESVSIGCVPEIRSEDCIRVHINRRPFEMVRIVSLEGQVDLASPGRSALLLPFIYIRDGKEAKLCLLAYVPPGARNKAVNGYESSLVMNEIAVVSNDSISFSRSSVGGLPGFGWDNLKKFGIAGGISSPAIILSDEDMANLSRVKPGSGVAVRFVLSYLGGEVSMNIGDKEAEQFATNFQLMLMAYNRSRGNLIPVGDPDESGKWLD